MPDVHQYEQDPRCDGLSNLIGQGRARAPRCQRYRRSVLASPLLFMLRVPDGNHVVMVEEPPAAYLAGGSLTGSTTRSLGMA